MRHFQVLLVLTTFVVGCEKPRTVAAPAAPDVAKPVEAPIPYEERDDYHTRHLDEAGKPKYVNALALEASPYLRQHAHNPVNWVPWGAEAFAQAKAQGRPILLSIGYSTCHWCHVMAEESFEDPEIAELMNTRYVAVKVDREERPDVDSLYMTAVQRIAGRGGWPMTVWLTPDGEPFHAATYIPPRKGARGAQKGFDDFLIEWSDKFATDPSGVVAAAKRVTADVIRSQQLNMRGGLGDGRRTLELALDMLQRSYDATNHGWGRQKFPMPSRIRFLLRAARYDVAENNALDMATQTLDAMARGGIFDHVAGGFHRYTTDPAWGIPHFEKMLYDNAMLIRAYTEAWQRTKSPLYAEVVRRTVEYLLREMRAPEGGFYAATDADSEREEGKFFVWTPSEIDAAAPKQAEALKTYFGVTARGNFEGGATVLRAAMSMKDAAAGLEMPIADFETQIVEGLEELRVAREKRIHPHLDDKVISAWNGLAIDALAYAGFVFAESAWIDAAAAAAAALPTEKGLLRRSVTSGRIGPSAFADDYAFVIAGLLTLFEVTADAAHLRRASLLQAQLDAGYRDVQAGGYFVSNAQHASELPVRQKLYYDGAIPSANSVELLNLIRLATLRDDRELVGRRDELLAAFGGSVAANPAGATEMLLGIDWLAGDAKEVVIAGESAEALTAVLRENFFPHYILARGPHAALVPWLEGKVARNDRPTAYVCRAYTCKLPTHEPAEFARQMRAP